MSHDTGRNAPCPCGSRKKYKKCCMGKRPRSHSLFLDMGRPILPEMVEITPDGRVSFYVDGRRIEPAQAHVETTYDRPKGPKVLRRVPLDVGELIVKPDAALTRYDRVFAVDTNTRPFKDGTISVAAIFVCEFTPVGKGKHVAAAYPSKLLELRNVSEQPENVAWKVVIESIQATPRFSAKRMVCILVDSDLGSLQHYNARTSPIVGDFYLPDGFELAYASADSGMENLSNQLMRQCDREARALIDRIMAGQDPDDLVEVKGMPFTHVRVWTSAEPAPPTG